MSSIEKSILETIIYFDIFDYPLRVNEIQKWLWKNKAEINETTSALNESQFLMEKLSSKDGFFFFPPKADPPLAEKGREGLIETRLKKYRFAEEKYKKAKRIIWILSKFPFVYGVAVCNDLGYSNSAKNGDIDLFIITKKNRVWTVRFLIVSFLKIFRLRPGETHLNAICPSFFVDEDHLNLRNFSAINPPEDDIHFAYWINQMTPVFGTEPLWERFYKENDWTADSLPNCRLFLTSPVRKIKISFIQKFGEIILFKFLADFVENFLRLKFLPEKIKEGMNRDNGVVIKEGILKLHTNDRRREYFKIFQERISKIIPNYSN